jgi:DNA-binding NarL/FixJ family response regulator
MGRLPSPRYHIVKAMALELGLEKLAELEVEAVRERPVPARLLAALTRGDGTIRGTKTGDLLTPREREVMVLLASGLKREEIADELGVGYETVKHHLKSIYRKLNVRNRVEAINAFIEEEA